MSQDLFRQNSAVFSCGLPRVQGENSAAPCDSGQDEHERGTPLGLRQEPGPGLIRSPLILSVFFGAHLDPDRLRRFLAAHRVDHERRHETYRDLEQRTDGDMATFVGDTLRFGLAYEEVFLAWINSVEARLTGSQPVSRPSGGTRAKR